MKPRAYYEAIATLTGCIIGAGILGIPYVVVRAGFWTGILVICVLGLAALLVHLMVGEVSLRSKKCHQLVGYADKYLGVHGKFLMTASMVIGIYGSLVAYTLGVSQSLAVIFGGSVHFWAFLFYLIMSFLLYGGLRVLERSELIMESFKLLLFTGILALLFWSTKFSPARFVGFSFDKVLIPYGVVLFAFFGTAAIPEVREGLQRCKFLTKRAIIIGSLIPFVCYILFTFAVVGVTGGATTEVATIGLSNLVGNFGFVLLHLFAILAMSTSFVALGYAMKSSYRLDYRLPHLESWLLTIVFPAVILMFGVISFVRTLEVAGTFAGGIAGIVIILMHYKASQKSERKPEYRVRLNGIGHFLLASVFVVGILYQLFLIF